MNRWALLEGVPQTEVERLLSIARGRRFARGEVVFHDDDPADTLHLIVKGRFAVRTQTRFGDAAILAVLGPGECFGEIALLHDVRRTATVRAATPLTVLVLGRDEFLGGIGSHARSTHEARGIARARLRGLPVPAR